MPESTLAPRPELRVLPRISDTLRFPRFELVGLLVGVGLLNLWMLNHNGYGNEYYAAAVRSMGSSWHLFLYGSFDLAGVMTVDKPPLFLWIQVASSKLFGLNSWGLLLPQAFMGVASVWFVYDMTRRRFGRTAGFVAGLVLGLTPICVAIFRSNNPDALLVLCCTAAVWFVVRGLEDGRLRWLVLAGVAVGLGFETKMAAALLVVPALVAACFLVAPRGRLVAVRQLIVFGAVMAVVGLAWPVMVWLTPARSRPWLSSTDDNSVWSLIFGYNGLGRIAGQAGANVNTIAGKSAYAGPPGPLRLINESLGTQIGWFLALAIVGGLITLILTRLRRDDHRTGWILAVGGTALTCAVVFSFADGIFHPYYTALLGPFIACLVGSGLALHWRNARPDPSCAKSLRLRTIGGVALGLTAVCEFVILSESARRQWLGLVILVVVALGALGFVFSASDRVRRVAIVSAVCVLFIAPANWSYRTTGYPGNATFPYGGPAVALNLKTGKALELERSRSAQVDRTLAAGLDYAAHHGGGTVMVASQIGNTSQAIIRHGANVAAIGGFSGRESEVSLTWLADAIAAGKIRWALPGTLYPAQPGDHRLGSARAMAAVKEHCELADAEIGIYDCSRSVNTLR